MCAISIKSDEESLNLLVNVLRESDVGNTRSIFAQEVNSRVEDRGVHGLAVLAWSCTNTNNIIRAWTTSERTTIAQYYTAAPTKNIATPAFWEKWVLVNEFAYLFHSVSWVNNSVARKVTLQIRCPVQTWYGSVALFNLPRKLIII